MSLSAYLLINTEGGKALRVLKDLENINEIKVCHVVTGLHDIIALVEAKDTKDLADEIVNKIQKVDGVSRTITCIVVNGNS